MPTLLLDWLYHTLYSKFAFFLLEYKATVKVDGDFVPRPYLNKYIESWTGPISFCGHFVEELEDPPVNRFKLKSPYVSG